jgi:hypothetical protein
LQGKDHGVSFVVIKREQVENTPPSPVESLGRIDVNTLILSKKYKEELKCTSAENQKLKVQVSKLTTELESARLKVAALEADKAKINYELVSLQVASDGQTRTIKDLEQRNTTLKCGKKNT